MKNCFILASVILSSAAVSLAASATSAATVTLVVHADSRTGRLVRSVAQPRQADSTAGASASSPANQSASPALQSLVDRIAERHAVDRDLVHSVIRVESNYNPLAVSSKGALGLMQLVPSTARRFGVSNSFDPRENVEGGVRYLKHLLDHYDGDNRLALAAYNAGEAAVARYGGVPPFPETRDYVFRVGKSVDLTKSAGNTHSKAGDAAAHSSAAYNPVRAVTDAMGRIYYKTP